MVDLLVEGEFAVGTTARSRVEVVADFEPNDG